MLENINYSLFALLNATPASSWWTIEIATFIAKDLIIMLPLLVVALWFWGPNQRQLVFKVMMALAISLTLSWIFGLFFPHERPFAGFVLLVSDAAHQDGRGDPHASGSGQCQREVEQTLEGLGLTHGIKDAVTPEILWAISTSSWVTPPALWVVRVKVTVRQRMSMSGW